MMAVLHEDGFDVFFRWREDYHLHAAERRLAHASNEKWPTRSTSRRPSGHVANPINAPPTRRSPIRAVRVSGSEFRARFPNTTIKLEGVAPASGIRRFLMGGVARDPFILAADRQAGLAQLDDNIKRPRIRTTRSATAPYEIVHPASTAATWRHGRAGAANAASSTVSGATRAFILWGRDKRVAGALTHDRDQPSHTLAVHKPDPPNGTG